MARLFTGFIPVASLLIVAACDSGVGPPMGTVDAGDAAASIDATPPIVAPVVCASVSGTRLRREIIEPVSGATQEFRIMDTVYDVECRYQAQDAGAYTCYPILSATSSAVFYQDSGCTSALARTTAGTPARQFTRILRASAMPCGVAIQEHRLIGAMSPVSGGDAIFLRDGLGACGAVTAPAGDYYVAGAPLGADAFVSATTEAFAATRVSQLVYAGNDSSKMCANNLLQVDSTLNVSCQIRFGTDGEEAYCMPVGGISYPYFTDDMCLNPATAVAVDACQTPAPKYVVEDTSEACGVITRVVTSVLPEEVTARYRDAGNNCKLEAEDTNTYYSLGGGVAESEFARLSLATEDIEGRVQRSLVVAGEAGALFPGRWFDTKLETPCDFTMASDGSFRCLPIPMQFKSLFTDIGCTSPITLAVEGVCGEPVGFMSRTGAMGLRIFSGKSYAPAVYELVSTVCTEYVDPVYEEDFEHATSSFQLGEIVLQ